MIRKLTLVVLAIVCFTTPSQVNAQAGRRGANRGQPAPDTLTRAEIDCSSIQATASPCDTLNLDCPGIGTDIAIGNYASLRLRPEDIVGKASEIDSVVWVFRSYEIPGVAILDNLDPRIGWVRIGVTSPSDSLLWHTNWGLVALVKVGRDEWLKSFYPCVQNGFYTVVAWIYYGSGQVCHSQRLDVLVYVPAGPERQ